MESPYVGPIIGRWCLECNWNKICCSYCGCVIYWNWCNKDLTQTKSWVHHCRKGCFDGQCKSLECYFHALNDDETSKISSCCTAHGTWEALKIAYKGDNTVKEQELQASQSKFEDLKIARVIWWIWNVSCSIINQAARIGHTLDDLTIVQKILRVLRRKRFGSWIDPITEATADIKILIVNVLVSKLRAYEVANEIAQSS